MDTTKARRRTTPRAEIGPRIREAMLAVQETVAAIHEGRLPPVDLNKEVRGSHIRWTPSFIAGAGPTQADSKPYTISHLARLMGEFADDPSDKKLIVHSKNQVASRWVRCAVLLLEGIELGYLDENFLQRVGQPGYRADALLKTLKELRSANILFA